MILYEMEKLIMLQSLLKMQHVGCLQFILRYCGLLSLKNLASTQG